MVLIQPRQILPTAGHDHGLQHVCRVLFTVAGHDGFNVRVGAHVQPQCLSVGRLGGEIRENSELDGRRRTTLGAECRLEDRAPDSKPRGGEADEPNDVEEANDVLSRHVHREVF